MNCAKSDLTIMQGKTFRRTLRWEAAPFIYKPITAISKSAPVNITATAHGIPKNWRVGVVSVKGMTQINAKNDPLKLSDYKQATVIDSDNIQFNDINSSEFSTHTANTGYLQFNTPVDMAGYSARLVIKSSAGGNVLSELTTENGGIDIDNTEKSISIYISATATAQFSWQSGVYEMEMISADGDVITLLSGDVTLTKEIATG